MNACGVAVARLQGHSWAPHPVERFKSERGNHPDGPSPLASQVGGWEGASSADAVGVGRRTRSSPSTGKPCHMAKGSSVFAAANASRGGRW